MKMRRPSLRWIVIAVIVGGAALLLRYQLATRTIAFSRDPNGSGSIRIVEVPTSWSYALLDRYNPYYRFEFHFRDKYLWSSTTLFRDSYRAKSASIQWQETGGAVCFLDGVPIFHLVGGNWKEHGTDPGK